MEFAEEKGAGAVPEARWPALTVSPAPAAATASASPRSTLSEYTTPRLLSSDDEDDRSLAARARSTKAAHSSQAAVALTSVNSAALTSAAAPAAAASARNSTVPEFSSVPSRSQTATATPPAAGRPRNPPNATPPQTPRAEKTVQPAAKVAGLPARRVSVPTRPLQPEPSVAAASVLPKAAAVSLTGSTPTTKRKSIAVPPELAPPSYSTVVTESISSTSEMHPFSRSIHALGSTSALSARRSLRTLNSGQYNPLPAAPKVPVDEWRAGCQRVDVEPAATAHKSAIGVRSRRSSQRSGSPHAIAAASAPEPPPVPPVSRPVVAVAQRRAEVTQSREYNWSESDAEDEASRHAPRKDRHERDDEDEDEEEATSESSSRSGDSTPVEEDERQRVSDAEIELFQKLWRRGGGPLDRSSSLRAGMGAGVAAEVQSLLSREASTRSWPKRARPQQTAAPLQRAQRPQMHREESEPHSPMNTSLVRNPHASHRSRNAHEDRPRPQRRERVGERVQSESPALAGRQRLDFETLLAMSPVIATPTTGRSDRVTFIMRELVVKYLSERQLLAEIFAPEPPAIEPPPQTLLETLSQMRATASESLSRWFESASELLAGGGRGGPAGAKQRKAEASEQSETRSSEQELDAESDAEAEWHTSRAHRRAHTARADSRHRRAKSREKTRQKRSSSRHERRSECFKRNPFCDAYYSIFDDFEAEFDFDKLAVLLVSCLIVLMKAERSKYE